MKRYYSLRIPEPCHEDWNQMTPSDKGRFCSSCAKTVIDFTVMNDQELGEFLKLNHGKNICGHVKQSQLDRIHIKIPVQVLHNYRWGHHSFLLTLLIVMGTTLMSCKDGNGIKQKIDQVEVVDSLSTDYDLLNDPAALPSESCQSADSLIQQVPITGKMKIPPPMPEPIILEVLTGEGAIVEGGISTDHHDEN